MGTTYRYLSSIEEGSTVSDWFRALPEGPVENSLDGGTTFYFGDFGPLGLDARTSPVVSVFLPVRKRGVMTTIGEVHFLATPLSNFPGLHKISKEFRKWLTQYPCVYSQRSGFHHEWDYYLEGSTKNWAPDIHALPLGMKALQHGEYFVAADDNDLVLDRVCQLLDLRGVKAVGG